MFQTIITATVLYTATAVDLLVILLIFFSRASTKKEYRNIYISWPDSPAELQAQKSNCQLDISSVTQ